MQTRTVHNNGKNIVADFHGGHRRGGQARQWQQATYYRVMVQGNDSRVPSCRAHQLDNRGHNAHGG